MRIGKRFERGVAAIEMALLIIPLLFFVLVASEIGRALYYYDTLVTATRDGARYLSMMGPGNGHAVARCLVVYGTRDCSGAPAVAGLTTDMVSIAEQPAVPSCIGAQCYGSIDLVTITVTGYSFHSFMLPLYEGTATMFTFADISTTMRQAVS